MTVEFEKEKMFNKNYNKSSSSQKPGLTDWLIKKGIARDEKGAQAIMIIITIICFALSIFLTIK